MRDNIRRVGVPVTNTLAGVRRISSPECLSFAHPGADVPPALPRESRVRSARSDQIHPAGVAGNSGCRILGRILYIS